MGGIGGTPLLKAECDIITEGHDIETVVRGELFNNNGEGCSAAVETSFRHSG